MEDDDDTREVLSLGLELAGAEVVAVASGLRAMETLRQWRPDVLLSDIGLPDQDGLFLMRQIRELPSGAGRIPAAAVTAFTLSDDLDGPTVAGFQRHFRKPVDTSILFAAIAELAEKGPVERRLVARRVAQQAFELDRRLGDRREAASASPA